MRIWSQQIHWSPLLPRLSICLSMLALLAFGTAGLLAEEPYAKFLERLKDEGLYELALTYLEELEQRSDVDPRFRSNLELERGLLLYQSAAILPTSNPLRPAKLEDAEQALRDFLRAQPRHPRRGEARLKIGELLLQRAEEAKVKQASGEQTTQKIDNQEAIRFFGEAHDLFESTIQELAGILEQIKGARTDPNDKQAVAYRQTIQEKIRQAQLLSAKSLEERGRSRAMDSPDRKADLQQALKMFSDLYSKEQRMVAVRNFALFYRSAIQKTLGMRSDAIDGFRRIADLEIDALRGLQTDAITELIQLLADEDKYPLAVDRGESWLKDLRPDEVESAGTVQLKLELAKLRVEWSKKLKKSDPDDRVANRLVRAARDDLRSLLRIPGPHLEQTQQLLGELGVATAVEETEEVPQVNTFAEAVAEAQQRIEQAETDALGLSVLREQGQSDQAAAAEQSIRRTRQQALTLLRESLRLYTPDDELPQLEQARFSTAYLQLKEENPWNALAVAEYIARKNPKTDQGLRAATVALAALSDLLRTGSKQENAQLTDHLEPFAKYLISTWPDSDESAAAASALVQLALLNEKWDRVEDYLALAPTSGPTAVKLHRTAGLSLFARYLQQLKKDGQASEASNDLKTKAARSLQIATSEAVADQMDAPTIEALNALARLQLSDGKVDEAYQLLIESPASPLKVIDDNPQLASPKVALNSYRTAIQLVISRLAENAIEPSLAIQQTADYIQQMQKLAEKTPTGASLLSGIFVSLTNDLKQQLTATSAAENRTRLSQAMLLLANEAGKSDSFSTLYWAADTILGIADELNSNSSTRQLPSEAYGQASNVLQRIMDKHAQQPDFIQPAGFEVQIRLMLARASRGLGDFKSALNQLAAILKQNSGLLDVQIEAAKTYQAWGGSLHKAAYLGGRPDPKTRKNLIWGWGRIARVVEGKQDYEEQFYLARYELARSRYKYAASLKDPEERSATYARAAKDITATATLYPELGGPAMKKRYDALLKQIQKSLGQPPTGLASLSTPE